VPGFKPGLWHSSHKQPKLLTTRLCPETHTKRQVTQQGCLPNLLGDGDKGTEIVYSEEKKFVMNRSGPLCTLQISVDF
jgi:hypothetical protein